MHRHPSFAVSLVAFLAVGVVPVAGQTCVGDCNSSGSVTVDELLVGLNIALGTDSVGACAAFEEIVDGAVTVDELVEGVRNALQGCGMSSSVIKASSSVALSSLYVMDFGSIGASSGAGAQSLTAMQGPSPAAAVGSGTGLPCQMLFSRFGGSETRCCDSGALTFEWSQCVLADGSVINGSYRVESEDVDLCFSELPDEPSAALLPPTGINFLIEFTDYTAAAGDFFGNFQVFVADFAEQFVPRGSDCGFLSSPDAPFLDPLGFAIRGEGTRFLLGSVRNIAGNGPSIFQDVGTTFGTLESEPTIVAVDVLLEDDVRGGNCLVDTQLDGVFSSTNLLTGRQFTESYEEFLVLERDGFDGSYLVDLEGRSTTDCLGQVEIFSHEPLKIFPDIPCPAGGELELTVVEEDSSSSVFYSRSGGIAFDFDFDGIIDERRDSCIDTSISECGVQQAQGICTSCSGPSDCPSSLACAPCVFCEGREPDSRCAPPGDFAICEDDVYGELFGNF